MAGLRPAERIRRHADFQRVYERGTRLQGRYATLFILRVDGLDVGRLGVAATKRLGGAVERNKAKRLVREVFRRNKPGPGVDIVVVPRRELLHASLTSIEAEYRRHIGRSLRQSTSG
jgi:ribonuclease P protein component